MSQQHSTIRLASKSPRRQELLTQLQIDFCLVDVEVDETPFANENPADYVRRLAIEKAQAGGLKAGLDLPVLGADTIVVIDNQILGKPRSQQDCLAMLTLLSGRSHQVMTSVAIVSAKGQVSDLIITDVTFRDILDAEKLQYWQTGEPCDKAGGYGIQGLGGKFVQRINGSYYAVVGLPLMETERLLAQA